jgi:esterase/lipase superfamily enzyme
MPYGRPANLGAISLVAEQMLHTRRAILTYIGAAGLAGCTARGEFGVAPAAGSAGAQSLLIATVRSADPAPIAYGPFRARQTEFASLQVSIPPDHQVGNIEWPPGPAPDPEHHFALVGAKTLPDIDALAAAERTLAADTDADAVLFVHGFNMRFAEGVYRHAQIAWDYKLQGPQIHFSWPSAARPLGYTYDRDSVLFARDGLVDVLLRLLQPGQPRLTVVGHSMGGLLVMEALRQIALQGDRPAFERLAGVTLISPDIDIDLFAMQAEALRPLPQPFSIAVAANDRMLQLSSQISGGGPRLGSVTDLAYLGDLGVIVIDMSELGGRGANHFIAGSSPDAIALIKGLSDAPLPDLQAIGLGAVSIPLGVFR